jgi:hypothetical protein
MKITLTQEQIDIVQGKTPAVVDTIVYPYRDPDPRAQGHLFLSSEEHEAWKAAVKARDAALDDEGNWATVYTGTENPDAMTVYDWVFYAQRPQLWRKESQIFSKKVIMRDPATGRVLHQGDLATSGVDTSAYAANGGVLAKYL